MLEHQQSRHTETASVADPHYFYVAPALALGKSLDASSALATTLHFADQKCF
jgi:hypothetical protein